MLNWNLLFKALQFFNFGSNIIDSIRMLFQGIETCIINAGFTSSYFSPANGVRQGCCASPLLFVIAVELQALMIRNDPNIKGISIRNTEYRISQFADDTTCFASDKESLDALISSLERFSSYSGLRLNYEKSSIVQIGRKSTPLTECYRIPVSQSTKILGIWFSKYRSEEQHYAWNYSPILDNMRKTCMTWSNRSLSLKGKITVFNTLTGSQIQYVCMNTVTPQKVLTEIRKIATLFLWNEKKSKIAYHSVIQDIPNGGLKLMDLPSRVRANHIGWIKRILRNPDCSSAEMLRNILGMENIDLALSFKRPTLTTNEQAAPFYRAILETWLDARDFEPLGEADIRAEVIWQNHHVSSPQHMLKHNLWKRWIEAGITMVQHICHDSENRILGHEEIQEKFHIRCNFLEALSLRNSIPFSWKRQLSANFKEEVSLNHIFYINQKRFDLWSSNPRQWYSEWIGKLGQPFSRASKWEEEIAPTTPLDWPAIHSAPYRATRETKMQSFAYKIAYRLIPCNRYLFQVRLKQSDLCEYCGETDNLSHFFLKCEQVKSFWDSLSQWSERYLDFSLSNLNEVERLFGIIGSRRNPRITNWLVLQAKFFIQKRRLFFQGNLPLIAFLREIRSALHIEKKACFAENKIRKFCPWQHLYDVLG